MLLQKKLKPPFPAIKKILFISLLSLFWGVFFFDSKASYANNPFSSTVSLGPSADTVSTPDSSKIDSNQVVVISIEKQIDPGITHYLKRAIAEAEAKNPEVIIFKINTFGGRLDAAFDIVDLISDINCCSTYAYIEKKAISAGALIALAAQKIAMGKGTTIGDCAPIIQGQQGIVMAGEKIESPLRAKFRNLAEKNGYPKLLAQSMVSLDLEILRVKKKGEWIYMTKTEWDDLGEKGQKAYSKKQTVVKKGELLTLTDAEAEDFGFSIGSFESLEEFVSNQGWHMPVEIKSNWSEKMVRFIGKLAPILMLIGFGALYMEIKTPGFGLFGFIGITALLIVFGSQYASGLANHTELLLLMAGVILFVVEIFVFPGTFLFGALGVVCLLISLILSMQGFQLPDPQFPWEKKIFIQNIIYVLGMAVGALVVPLLLAKYLLPYLPGQNKLIVNTTLKDSHAASVEESHPELQVGQTGVAATDLRPFGKIKINDKLYEASCPTGFIEKNRPISIQQIAGLKVTVGEIKA